MEYDLNVTRSTESKTPSWSFTSSRESASTPSRRTHGVGLRTAPPPNGQGPRRYRQRSTRLALGSRPSPRDTRLGTPNGPAVLCSRGACFVAGGGPSSPHSKLQLSPPPSERGYSKREKEGELADRRGRRVQVGRHGERMRSGATPPNRRGGRGGAPPSRRRRQRQAAVSAMKRKRGRGDWRRPSTAD